MGTQVPLGKRENLRLEFKSAGALRNPFSISRAAVGMLNASGGEIWVGLRESNGIAVELEELGEVEHRRQDLLNHMLEVIEPRLRSEDISIETVSVAGKNALLVHVAAASERGPFAQVKDGGRHFFIRVDHRIRPMTREEIFAPRAPIGGGASELTLVKLRDDILKRDWSGLWVGIQTVPPLDVNVQNESLTGLLVDPARSGNRESGWNFAYPAVLDVRPKIGKGRLSLGEDGSRRITVRKDGCVEILVSMIGLRHRIDSVREIYPLALIEHVVSVMRLAKVIYGELAESPPIAVLVDLALLRAEGWHLPAYAPGTYGYSFEHGSPTELEEGQYLSSGPIRLSWPEFLEHPDRAGFLLVRALYEAFHLPEDRIPKEYNREAHRLVIGTSS